MLFGELQKSFSDVEGEVRLLHAACQVVQLDLIQLGK